MTNVEKPGAPVSARKPKRSQIETQVSRTRLRIFQACIAAVNADGNYWQSLCQRRGDPDKLEKQKFEYVQTQLKLCNQFESLAVKLAGYDNWPAFEADYWEELFVDDDEVEFVLNNELVDVDNQA
jgi:hypothetical protein